MKEDILFQILVSCLGPTSKVSGRRPQVGYGVLKLHLIFDRTLWGSGSFRFFAIGSKVGAPSRFRFRNEAFQLSTSSSTSKIFDATTFCLFSKHPHHKNVAEFFARKWKKLRWRNGMVLNYFWLNSCILEKWPKHTHLHAQAHVLRRTCAIINTYMNNHTDTCTHSCIAFTCSNTP